MLALHCKGDISGCLGAGCRTVSMKQIVAYMLKVMIQERQRVHTFIGAPFCHMLDDVTLRKRGFRKR